jgi:hypothetical protein
MGEAAIGPPRERDTVHDARRHRRPLPVNVDAAAGRAHTVPGGVAVQLRASRTRSPRERTPSFW